MICIGKLFKFFIYLKRIENGASFVWFNNYLLRVWCVVLSCWMLLHFQERTLVTNAIEKLRDHIFLLAWPQPQEFLFNFLLGFITPPKITKRKENLREKFHCNHSLVSRSMWGDYKVKNELNSLVITYVKRYKM